MTFVTSSIRARAVDHLALAVCTTKGLFFVSDGAVDGPLLAGDSVGAFLQVEDRLLAATTRQGQAPAVLASDDGGLSWSEPRPTQLSLPDGSPAAVWQLHLDDSGTVWAGTENAALLRSDDFGESFQVVPGLYEHPDREKWGPAGGGLALHSILTHPQRPGRMLVAISAGGVYRSDDGGETWEVRNEGIAPGATHESRASAPDVHKLAVDASNPDLIWAQASSGIYKSQDGGDHWEAVGHTGEPNGLPSDFGFPVVADPEHPATAYVVPLESSSYRCTPQGRCRVYRTTDGGQSWEALSSGLPGPDAHVTVLRDAFSVGSDAPYSLVFGSKSGHVFASADHGDSWRLVTSYLPPILCVRVLS